MALDHSQTYRGWAPRNLPHRLRLRAILRTVRACATGPISAYGDFGCSNGYITEKVRTVIAAERTWGLDHSADHLKVGRGQYHEIDFDEVDLNRKPGQHRTFDFVTCFETLEHTGDLQSAVENLLCAVAPGGVVVISVPIEIGPVGALKFIAKLLFGYTLSELPPRRHRLASYVSCLLTGRRISQFREPRTGWGTHFGFDYRDVDDLLARRNVGYRAWNQATTRFYVIDGVATARRSPASGREASEDDPHSPIKLSAPAGRTP